MKIFPDHEHLQIHVLDERFYESPEKENTWYPGGTEILKAYPKGSEYEEWLKNLGPNADFVRDQAAEDGSLCHNLIDTFIKGEPTLWTDEIKLKVWQGYCRFQEFYWRYKPKTIFTEKIVVSDELGYGGQLDYAFELDGENWLIDHKFTNSIRKTHYLQICAYNRLMEPYIKFDRIGILHLKSQHRKEAEFQGIGWKLWPIPKKDWDHYLALFDYTHNLWKEENPNFKPKNKIYPMSFKIDEEPDKELLYGNG